MKNSTIQDIRNAVGDIVDIVEVSSNTADYQMVTIYLSSGLIIELEAEIGELAAVRTDYA